MSVADINCDVSIARPTRERSVIDETSPSEAGSPSIEVSLRPSPNRFVFSLRKLVLDMRSGRKMRSSRTVANG